MTICPYCAFENIEGVDVCDECGQPLSDLHLPTPATEVERSLLKDHVHVLQPRDPHLVAPDMPVRDVLQKMVREAIGCVLVGTGDNLLGIFTERDALVKLNVDATEMGDRPVSEFMTSNPDALTETAKVAFATHRMDVGGYRHVPVVTDNGKPTGVISVRDILRYLTEKLGASEPS